MDPDSISDQTWVSLRENCAYPVFLIFDVHPSGESIIPTTALYSVFNYHLLNEETTVACPLNSNGHIKRCSSADTILKYFGAIPQYVGRLAKVITSKGELYYGRPGLIFDKDFNALLFGTSVVYRTEGSTGFTVKRNILHVHPKVFTDDSGILNRNILKKALPFILSDDNGLNEGLNSAPWKVVIDDSSEFIKTTSEPVENLDAEITHLLQENIDEVLNQIRDDVR